MNFNFSSQVGKIRRKRYYDSTKTLTQTEFSILVTNAVVGAGTPVKEAVVYHAIAIAGSGGRVRKAGWVSQCQENT